MGNGMVLTHGAGSNAQAPLLVALAETFSAAGYTVLRCDLPYRQVRHWGPPGPGDATRDRAGLKNAVAALKPTIPGPVYLAGHSYGGRQSSILCAEEPDLVAGLLLLSYPLHPPQTRAAAHPASAQSAHAVSVRPHGTRDPFGSIAELSRR